MSVDLKDYQYSLPEERIAKFPLNDRSSAKLLVYEQGAISHSNFSSLTKHLPPDSFLFFNNTRVIPARIIFHRESGARIEVFLLEPSSPSNYEQSMSAQGSCCWHCMIGNAKRWKETELEISEVGLKATRNQNEVTFYWDKSKSFSEILEEAGKIPLPPYIHREVTEDDKETYQTVYSKNEGAVAAPTAGLHFTEEILAELEEKGFQKDFLTLHVSAGTFQPIKAETVEDHPMHREQIIVTKENVENLLQAEKVISVGTTSMRTLESLYWYGVKLLNGEEEFFISQTYAYEVSSPPPTKTSLAAVLDFMNKRQLSMIIGHTEIFIYPGYALKVCHGLITNFHLPGSTLILLIAALVGDDWRKVYDAALANDYRFLSYGDSSLLMGDI